MNNTETTPCQEQKAAMIAYINKLMEAADTGKVRKLFIVATNVLP